MAIYNNPGYESKTWHYFLIYQATNIIVLLYNIFAIRRTTWIHDVGCMYYEEPLQIEFSLTYFDSHCFDLILFRDFDYMPGTYTTNVIN